MPSLCPPRLRQAVLAASDLTAVANQLRATLQLREPYADPAVEAFGLRNAVFALGDTFLEVVAPCRSDTAAGRRLERRGGDCGYMVMFQVADLPAARRRAAARGVREVFEAELEDITEVHLHPGDMRGAIVALSAPRPPGSWRWGGPGWEERGAGVRVAGATIAVSDARAVAALWSEVLGAPAEPAGVEFEHDPDDAGLVAVRLEAGQPEVTIGGVRFH